jgi:hypothetical protein
MPKKVVRKGGNHGYRECAFFTAKLAYQARGTGF